MLVRVAHSSVIPALGRLLGVLGVVALALALSPARADARPANGYCDGGELCLYDHANFGGILMDTPGSYIGWDAWNMGDRLNDRVSSWRNRSGVRICAYNHPWWADRSRWLWTMFANREQSYVGGVLNDRLDYVARC